MALKTQKNKSKNKTCFQFCVSGAAGGPTVAAGHNLAFELGAEIVKAGHAVMTGATIGLPDRAAQGAKSVGGQSIGISPAESRLSHMRKYRLPTEAYDVILFTGLHYVGRDVLLVTSSDAVFFVGGRIGTLHEFTATLETHKPAGVLLGAGGTSEEFDDVLKAAGIREPEKRHIYFDDNPKRLVKKITDACIELGIASC